MDVEDPLVDREIDCGEYTTNGRVKTRRYTILGTVRAYYCAWRHVAVAGLPIAYGLK